MAKKINNRVILFASIEEAQHEALHYIAYKEKRSIADITREALANYITRKSTEYPIGELKASAVEIVEAKASPLRSR
ncbi:MAG: hypothetical protein IBX36_00875 [Dehalococcoidia bacterium]|nr:hypothetical protein [Dehalococcoidia bacterium]